MKRWLPLGLSLLVLAMGPLTPALADRLPGPTELGDLAAPWWDPGRSALTTIMAGLALALALATGGICLARRRWRWPLAMLLMLILALFAATVVAVLDYATASQYR